MSTAVTIILTRAEARAVLELLQANNRDIADGPFGDGEKIADKRGWNSSQGAFVKVHKAIFNPTP